MTAFLLLLGYIVLCVVFCWLARYHLVADMACFWLWQWPAWLLVNQYPFKFSQLLCGVLRAARQ